MERAAFLREHGGLYVDLDFERIGDVWQTLESAGTGGCPMVTVRPARPAKLEASRPCNGILYASGDRSIFASLLDAMLAALKAVEGKPKPMDVTWPVLLGHFAERHGLPVVQPPWAAFWGEHTPETWVVTHHHWRRAVREEEERSRDAG